MTRDGDNDIGPERVDVDPSAVMHIAYLAQLGALAAELEHQAAGRCDPTAIRMLWQRLRQWIEDLRSMNGNSDVVNAVEALAQRLLEALAAPAKLATEVTAVVEALSRLATGAPPPPEKKNRLAFWK